jgi:hypothetical protein
MSHDYIYEARAQRRDGGKKLISGALKDYSVRDINQGYCFRVNGTLDLYPTNGKFHNLKTNVRGYYPSKDAGKLIKFVVEQMSNGNKVSRKIHHAAHSGSGECVFCGGKAKLYMCDNCKAKPIYLMRGGNQDGGQVQAVASVS